MRKWEMRTKKNEARVFVVMMRSEKSAGKVLLEQFFDLDAVHPLLHGSVKGLPRQASVAIVRSTNYVLAAGMLGGWKRRRV